MSFQVTRKRLTDPQFHAAVRKLMNSQITDMKTNYWAGRVCKKLQREADKVFKTYQKEVIDTYAERDEEGNVKVVPHNPTQFEVKEDQKEGFTEFVDEWMDQTVEFEFNPLPIGNLSEIRFTPSELMELEPILAGLEAFEDEA